MRNIRIPQVFTLILYMDVTFTRFDEAEHIVVILMRIVDRGMLYAVC